MDELLTPAEVAERTGVTPGTARQWMADDKVPGAFRFGATYLVATGDLRAAMEAGEVGLRSEPEGNGPPAITSRQAMVMLGRAGIDVDVSLEFRWQFTSQFPFQIAQDSICFGIVRRVVAHLLSHLQHHGESAAKLRPRTGG